MASPAPLLGADEEEGGEDDDEEEEEEMPEELAGLDPAEQQRRLMTMSFTTMGLGTALVVLFSDPMTDVLGGMSIQRCHFPSFFFFFSIVLDLHGLASVRPLGP